MSSLVYSVNQKLKITQKGVVNTSVIKAGGDAWPMVICLNLLLLRVFS